MDKSGVYHILNLENGKLYIGATKNWKERLVKHRGSLRSGRHHNKHLQNSWNKYGEEAFEFKLIYRCPEGRLKVVEQETMDSFDFEDLYNIRRDAQAIPKHSGTVIEKLRKASTGVVFSEERRRKIGDAKRGTKHTEETKRKMSIAHKGRKVSKETREKMSKSAMGKIISQEQREKARQNMLGNVPSETTRKKISKAMMGRSTEWLKGRVQTEEHKANVSKALKGKKKSKEHANNARAGRSAAGSYKLNFKKAEEIRSKYSTGGYTYKKLSKEYGVCTDTILKVVNFRLWKNDLK